MPIEIRELIIRVQVTNDQPHENGIAFNHEQLRALKKEITAHCLQKIKKESRKKKER